MLSHFEVFSKQLAITDRITEVFKKVLQGFLFVPKQNTFQLATIIASTTFSLIWFQDIFFDFEESLME